MVTGYFGLPGSGKTTFLTRIAQKELTKIAKGKSPYSHILTNFYCRGCEKIDYRQLGNFEISNALILLDEITLDADSRNFKQFDDAHKQFFLLHRHYNCDVIYFTQQYDGVDKKIRDITSNLFFVKKFLFFSVATKIFRTLDINEFTKDIVQGYRFANISKDFQKMLYKFVSALNGTSILTVGSDRRRNSFSSMNLGITADLLLDCNHK